MTIPPQSPYGRADPADAATAPHGAPQPPTGVQASNGQSPYGQAPSSQSPYNQSPYIQQAAPNGYVGTTPPNAGNGPGRAAFALGIVSVVSAFIPIVGFLTFLLGPAGVITGIVGLKQTDRPRRQASWGIALSGASMGLFILLSLLYLWIFTLWANDVGFS